jgi:chromosome segregation ATPase
MSVHIHIPLSELFNMATASSVSSDGVAAAAASDAAAKARVSQEAAHQEELKKLQQIIHEQKGEITRITWDSFAAAAKERNTFDEQTKDLTDRLQEAVYQNEQRVKERNTFEEQIKDLTVKLHDAEETINKKECLLKKKQIETSEAWERADVFKMHFYRDKKQFAKEAEEAKKIREELEAQLEEEKEQVAELLDQLELAETSKSRATERALAAEKFDTCTTFYKMKIEEAEEICEKLKKQLKEEGETLDEVSRRECALGQRVRDLKAQLEKPNTRAEKMEGNFLRLCAAIDITLKDSPDYRKKLWDQYTITNAYPLMPWEERVLDYRRAHPSTWVPTCHETTPDYAPPRYATSE